MPARRMARRPVGRARPGRPGTWARLVDAEILTAATKTLMAVATLSTSFNETVRRVIVDAVVQSDQVSASERFQVAMGMCVVSDAAIAAGAASLPGPLTDLDDDLWFFWTAFHGNVSVGATALNVQNLAQPSRHVESRAMRRVVEGQQVAIMAEAGAVGVDLLYSLSLYSTFAT